MSQPREALDETHDAGDGRVTSAFPLHQLGDSRVAGDINGGGPPIVVTTGDGSIQLSQL